MINIYLNRKVAIRLFRPTVLIRNYTGIRTTMKLTSFCRLLLYNTIADNAEIHILSDGIEFVSRLRFAADDDLTAFSFLWRALLSFPMKIGRASQVVFTG